MSLQIYRLSIEDPESWPEPVGESVARIGPVPVPGARSGTTVSATLNSFTGAITDTKAQRQAVRRQLRSLLNNIQTKTRGYWIQWSEDGEQDGWYVPGSASFDVAGEGGLFSAFWKFSGVELALLGRDRTHRRGAEVEAYDRRLTTTPIDFKGTKFGGAFSTMDSLRLVWLPSSITDPTIQGLNRVSLSAARTGAGSSQLQAAVDATHLAVISFEQGAGYRHRGDVVVYDRRGTLTAPSAGADAAWEEVYGPDFPWLNPSTDTPVLDNSLCRVRWDATNGPGLALDRWDGTSYTEHGKILVRRLGDTAGFCDTLVRADLVESSSERAVLRIIAMRAADAYSREEIFVTLQRGWYGPRVEIYPAPLAAGTPAGAAVVYTLKGNVGATATRQDSAVANVQPIQQTDTTFSANYGAAVTLGTATFGAGSENWAALIPSSGTDGPLHLAVLQTGLSVLIFGDSTAYGAARNGIAVSGSALGYCSAQLAATGFLTDANLEAEAMTLSSGTTSGADAGASGGNATSATRTAEADHVTRAAYAGGKYGLYRILVRCRNAAAGTLNVRAQTAATTGTARTTTSTSYVWLDLGQISVQSAADTLQIRAWRSTAGTFWIDRVVGIPVEQRQGTAPLYAGARDLGEEVLWQTVALQRVVPR